MEYLLNFIRNCGTSPQILVNAFNFSFQLEEMTTSQRQAIITPTDKKGKGRSYLEKWRPLSLVNVDAKIASKVIANRIKCWLQILSTITNLAL